MGFFGEGFKNSTLAQRSLLWKYRFVLCKHCHTVSFQTLISHGSCMSQVKFALIISQTFFTPATLCLRLKKNYFDVWFLWKILYAETILARIHSTENIFLLIFMFSAKCAYRVVIRWQKIHFWILCFSGSKVSVWSEINYPILDFPKERHPKRSKSLTNINLKLTYM